MAIFRIATWNLERPRGARAAKFRRQLASMTGVSADIWVLTESHKDACPGSGYQGIFTDESDRDEVPGEVWSAVWSRHPIRRLCRSSDAARAAVAIVEPPDMRPIIVYATVLPWLGSSWRGVPGIRGQAFARALDAQREDWQQIRKEHPHCELVVAGDFNQSLSERHYYGSRANAARLREALSAVGLRCLTADEGDPVFRQSGGKSSAIDHICVSKGMAVMAHPQATVWPETDLPVRSLSDHFGVAVDFGVS